MSGLDTTIPRPLAGRTYSATRRVRLSDMDVDGRVRLDAVARFLQDIAIDDVQETGWGVPEHLWFVRRVRLDVQEPLVADRTLELTTWCSGVAAIAAGRRWSVTGDAGGRVEVDSVWIHLDARARPARIGDFGVYGVAAGGRPVSTHLELPDPPPDAARMPWQIRVADVDRHGHVNNAVYWQAVEEALPALAVDPRARLRVELDYRTPIDYGEPVEVATYPRGLALLRGDDVRAVGRIERS